MDVEQRAREMLAAEIEKLEGYKLAAAQICAGTQLGPIMAACHASIMAALTPPEGHVVVTRNEAGQAVAVTRQDDEGRILSMIAEFEPPEGYVLVDAKLLGAVRVARLAILQKQAEAEQMDEPHDASMWAECAADLDAIAPRGMRSALPEVPDGRG